MDATYRGDLRELNELNFSRFDASVGERFAVSELKFVELERRLNAVELALHRRFDVMQWRTFGLFAAQFAIITGLYLK